MIAFEPHLHLAKPQNLTRLQGRFFDLLPIDESPVRGVQVVNHNVAAPQKDLAVMAGDRCVGNLERVVLDAPNRCLLRLQLMRASGESFAENNKSWHRVE